MQVVSGVNSRPFRPSLSYMTHLRPLIATTLIMGKDRGINGTAGIKTKFDGPSRESGTESIGVSAAHQWKLGVGRCGRHIQWGSDQVSYQSQQDPIALMSWLHMLQKAAEICLLKTKNYQYPFIPSSFHLLFCMQSTHDFVTAKAVYLNQPHCLLSFPFH